MNASISGALSRLNRSYKMFTHKGKRMTKEQVRKVLEYGIDRGYRTTDEFSDDEIDSIIKQDLSKTL